MPCLKCEQCGEVAFSNDVAQRLDEIVDSIKGLMTEVAIVEYSDNVA
nr:MAG TPA: MqsA [Bacteriophage sp.]